MSAVYFSDREFGPRPRTEEKITDRVWGGIVALLTGQMSKGAFGLDYPDECPDGQGIAGTDEYTMQLALSAEVPNLVWPLKVTDLPSTPEVLDFIEFCHRHVAKPIRGSYHSYFGHYHLSLNREEGQVEFRDIVNRIFARNGVAYELQDSGQVQRLAPPVLREALAISQFNTGDTELDAMLESSRSKYLSPDLDIRKESLEKLWDAWERLKTIEPTSDKKASIECLLNKAASEANFRAVLEKEALELTRIGNKFKIRHSETSQIPLESSQHIDYLFHRLFTLIQLILRSR
ncbi:hypothetical protein ES707_19474 [subsurface metagenome]